MDLVECVTTRRVTRGFKNTPVPKDLLIKILDAARNCASALNTQSWEFVVFGGKTIEGMRTANEERHLSGAAPDPDIPHGIELWPEQYRARILGRTGPTLLNALKIDPADEEGRAKLWTRGARYWGAPNGIIITTDKKAPQLSIFDCGGMVTTIILLSHSYGLGCCPSLQMVFWPDIVREHLKVPESKMIVMGICIGYPDEEDPINTFKAARVPLEELATWHGV
jgi:nitroreductase